MSLYNLEELNKIEIKDVLEALGAKPSRSKRLMHCPNTSAHKNGDKNPSMGIDEKHNICKCFVCNLSGNPVTVATKYFDDFKKACEFLHSQFQIPYLDGKSSDGKIRKKYFANKNKINYYKFDDRREYKKIKLKNIIQFYDKMNDKQKLKIIYTFVYRFALKTNQSKKILFYKTRALEKSPYLDFLGFLSKEDISNLREKLLKLFPLKDLQKFKLLVVKGQWKYGYNVVVVPSFDLYSNMVEGFMLRYTDNRSKGKEVNISCTDIVYPLPFGLGAKTLKSSNPIWITEGHIDGLSIASQGKNIASFGGVYAYKEEMLGLFKNKNVIIAFDKDKAGEKAQAVLIEKLKRAGANVRLALWKADYGKDLNDLLKNKKIQNITII